MHKNKKHTHLNEVEGVSDQENTHSISISNIKSKRKKQLSTQDLINGIIKGDISTLSRAITLIESTNDTHSKQANDLIKGCLPYSNNAIRIGITGVPGVGKSTFIEAFGTHITKLGKKVAVLAVDPSSSVTKGSILGDKTRMEQLTRNKNAYIRPSASGTTLGGVARKTREAITLCEAAGFDIIIIETVGVGQSETMVHNMVDFFLLLKLARSGDELQGIKRGIIEMADAIAINKADGDALKDAQLAKVEFNRALHFYPNKPSGWQPKVLTCSALNNEGIYAIYDMISSYIELSKTNNHFQTNRINQNKFWLQQTIESELKRQFFNTPSIQKEFQKQLNLIENNKISPFAAAEAILRLK